MGLIEVHALSGVSFKIQKGEVIAIMGPFRVGKIDINESDWVP